MKPKKAVRAEKKPYLKGNLFSGSVVKQGLKVLVYEIVAILAFVIFSSMLIFDSAVVTIILNVALVSLAVVLFYGNGAVAGETDVTLGENLFKRKEQGGEIAAQEIDRSYHPLKGVVAACIAALPLVVLAVCLAVQTQVTLYEQSVLPSWLSPYTRLQEFGGALAYYNVDTSITAVEILRIVVRACLMPYVAMLAKAGETALYVLEKCSPLLMLINPLAYAIGYTRGPSRRQLVHSNIAQAKKRDKAKARRDKARREHNGPEQLI